MSVDVRPRDPVLLAGLVSGRRWTTARDLAGYSVTEGVDAARRLRLQVDPYTGAVLNLPAVVAGIARSLVPSVARTRGAGAKASAQRIRRLGTTPARIRAWCAENGVPCPSRGVVPTVAVEAWSAAHPTTRTAEEAS